ncbi:M14 family zinc carboxypeptidase [Amycolatopsis magusensis]|uniref:Peptidase M14 domain-containing protein n=1 Tax=Amycolatopsis magusensis TaxID=882444 RepID=A0ABS4PRK7_9PSEU|nr:M14 family zinc carboxypeptidase [Amycolatopsis magusensis]MBP2182046.1 hypothetical protein [Amycolatopsis magusensis]
MREVARITGSMTPATGFPTVDQVHRFTAEIAEKHPDAVTVTVLGRSKLGDPIHHVRVGGGPRQVVVIGSPHPNEPIGLLTIRQLLCELAQDTELREALGATWHFVPCADPDGTRLNEGWFDGPLTRDHVARNFYRPPSNEQVEWTFPVEWRGQRIGTPIPETRALMKLIDATRPQLIASLHNADFGGGFFYVSGGDAEYYAALTALLDDAGIPLDRGEPDAPGARALAPAVFEMPSFGTIAEAMGAPLLTGGSTRDYSARYGSAVLISELPLWVDYGPAYADESYAQDLDFFTGLLQPLRLSGRSPFERAITDALRWFRFAGGEVWPSVIRLRCAGMLLRLFADEPASPEIDAARAKLTPVFERWCAEVAERAPGTLVPPHRLAGVQAGAIVTAVTRLRDGLPV